MPLNYKASVPIGLAFIELILRHKAAWLSKDLIFLFYEDLPYAMPVQEFLEDYYNHD